MPTASGAWSSRPTSSRDYDRWMTPALRPRCTSLIHADRAVRAARHFEEVQLFCCPAGDDGTMYGLCGLRSARATSSRNFAQPTGFDRLSCLLAPAGDGLDADAALSRAPPAATTMPPNTLVFRATWAAG